MEAQQVKAHGDEINSSSVQCKTHVVFDATHQRRSANYKPSLWKYDFLESLTSKYDEKEYIREAEKLKKDVKDMFVETKDLRTKLELINSIKKLGLAYHFEEEINKAIDTIAITQRKYPIFEHDDLYLASLCFRLLRQQGYHVSQEMFGLFMDDIKCVTKKRTAENVKATLELLEASHLRFEGENTIDDAQAFASEILRNVATNNKPYNFGNITYNDHVNHALEIPSHWRVKWFDVKWQMNAFQKQVYNNNNNNLNGETLLELAKLNFNMVQSTLQKDLKELSSWWKNLGLTQRLNFARDRLVESFMCTVGLAFQPQYKCLRKCLTKVVNFILIIDDIYDLYGSLEELTHFTNAVERWDYKEIEQLPDCMKICFQALYDTTCEIANDIETEIGCKSVLPHLQKVWTDFCKSLLVEAEWDHKGYIPSFEEYLSNAWISSSGPLLLIHSYLCTSHHDGEVTEKISEYFEKNQDLLYNISLIIRLCNDIGTSAAEQERGDAPSSILCYMREMNTTEDMARKNIRDMIAKTWRKINNKCFGGITNASSPPSGFVDIALNAARVAHNLYQSGDAFGVQVTENKKLILSLIVEPLIAI